MKRQERLALALWLNIRNGDQRQLVKINQRGVCWLNRVTGERSAVYAYDPKKLERYGNKIDNQ